MPSPQAPAQLGSIPVQNLSPQSTPIHNPSTHKQIASTLAKHESKQTIEPSSLYRIYDIMMRNKQMKGTTAVGPASTAQGQKKQLTMTANSDDK